ncbi:4-carboxymuconolactone decarboxylase [Mycobacterium sp. NS-7484]|uniref:carboxymuconolactone decarboxylase family protein n=1 Tax=Mycobacterium sp. NS-7484 TaxID=1834161 RepID=UPI00096ED8E0|nr:carboxymuconolactone decarboxylase family protein [Mycobacterium sp. NS-7484]OMC01413.1 4-carboxymuconolactone decarboxylase [Mycobacterium sp. NS-7484]
MTQTLEPAAAVDRLKIYKASPGLYDAMMTLSNAASKDVDPTIAELIKIRASQLNRCAFCLDMHTHDARQNGEAEQRLSLIAAWEEAGDLFTEQEKAAFALTEAITDLTGGPVSDAVYARAAAAFTEHELGQVVAMAVTINAWNRINAVAKSVPPRR